MRKLITVIALPVVLVVGMAACEPSDTQPNNPKPVRTKYIDPASKRCVRYERVNRKRQCAKWKTDDKDYVIVTTDGKQYDVDADEYNSVKVGDNWPR